MVLTEISNVKAPTPLEKNNAQSSMMFDYVVISDSVDLILESKLGF